MAIPSRQIGWSTKANLLWQISKQLEYLKCVTAGKCSTTTTTTTTLAPTSEWYEVTECYTTNVIYSVEYPVGTFQLNDGVTYYIGGDWTITNIFYTDPGGVQFGLSNIFQIGCPTTTTTTTIPLVNTSDTFQQCSQQCGIACTGAISWYDVWMTQECIDSFPTIGCEIWGDDQRTKPFSDGTYNLGNGDCIVITGGIITDILTY